MRAAIRQVSLSALRASAIIRMFCCASLLALSASAAATCPESLNYKFNTLVGDRPVDLCQYAGKVVLVVNTASQCGYTPQYAGLEALYRKYRAKGLVVLGFPANDFGGQEPGSNNEIARFCEENYGVSFPMFSKSDDRPLRANPLYARLIAATGKSPRWNFHKYLIDKTGHATSFESGVEPDGKEMVRAIESALAG